MRKFFVGGNWKMQADSSKVNSLIEMLNGVASTVKNDLVEIVVAPTFVFLERALSKLNPTIQVSAQNCYKETLGAFTGEVSAKMLKDLNCKWVILGHSERRHIFGETDEMISAKAKQAQEHGLKVIYCIGELLSERNENKTTDVILRQMKALISINPNWKDIVIAYEPVWAIGTGVTATPEQAEEVHDEIRKLLTAETSSQIAESVRIIYGGSVTASNCKDLSLKPNVDGFLVGGASLKEDFITIINSKK